MRELTSTSRPDSSAGGAAAVPIPHAVHHRPHLAECGICHGNDLGTVIDH
jgi:hypothetical protein